MAPGFNPSGILILFLTLIIAYVVPSIIAYALVHKHRTNITIVNLLLGWTIIGWLGCLVYSSMCLWKSHLCDEEEPTEEPRIEG